MVLVHGGAHTGTCFLRTVDGRDGWAHDFVRHGHRVIVPDWPGRGRSGYIPENDISGELVCAALAHVIRTQDAPVILLTHSMSGQFGWKLLEQIPEHIAAIVAIAPGPPGNMQPEPIVLLDSPEEIRLQFFANSSVVTIRPDQPFVATVPWTTHKLIGDGTQFPRELIEMYVASLNPVPPRLLVERSNFRGASLKITNLAVIQNKHILLVVGTNDTDHPLDLERATHDWLAAQGAHVGLCYLADFGMTGNGHMPMLERNSTQISDLIESLLVA
jgi:pimeloyl-ACP methyl ester carboxylesterase